MNTNSNRPFAGPRVALPSHFPKSFRNSQPDNPCRNLIIKLSDQSISSSEFFTQLLSIQGENREISFSILNCLLFYILHCKPYHAQFCTQFTALFTKLIQNPSEPVRRSVLSLISMVINNTAILQSLSNEFHTWKDESKEIFLSFAFCFQPPEVFEWKPFLSNAKKLLNSENESLSCTANDFIEFMNYFLGKDQNKPKVRNSLDLTKEQFRRSMNFLNSMDFEQNQMNEIEDISEEDKGDDDENFVIDDSSLDYNYNIENKNKSSARSSNNSDIRSLRVSKQKNAIEELENDPFNQKSPFFDSLENELDDSSINAANRQSKKSFKTNESDSIEDSSIVPNRSNKPQVIESVDLSKLKNETNSSKTSHSRGNSNSHMKSKKELNRSSNKSSKSKKDTISSDAEIDDTNIEIEDIDIDVDFDMKSNSSGNLSDILDNEPVDMSSLLPKNLSPQKANVSNSRLGQSKQKTQASSQKQLFLTETKTKSSQSKLITSTDSNKQKSSMNLDQNSSRERKQQRESSESFKTQKKNSRNNHNNSFDAQTMIPTSKSKQQQKTSSTKQSLNDQNSYDQLSDGKNENISFTSQPARPSSVRRNRQNNVSTSDSSSNTKSILDSQLNFVDIDGVEDSNISNSSKRSSSKLIKNSSNHEFGLNDDDDDDYSDEMFGAAPDYENKVKFSGPRLANTPGTPDRKLKSRLPKKYENGSKSGSSKTMSPSSVRKRPDSRSSNSSTESLPVKSKSPSRNQMNNDDEISSTIYSYASNLNNKDWEQQQRSVEGLRCILNTKPGLVSPYCREIWMNLLDIIVSPRSMLSNAALQLAAELFTQFAPQLVGQTAIFVDICFNLVCNSRNFISEGAENVIILIAQESPRSKVLNSFIKGTSHKNPIARAKAAQCLAILVEQEGQIDDREFKAIVQCLVPLVRDNRTDTRYAAKETLKLIAGDERFKDIANDVCTNTLDYNELMKCIEL